MFLILTALVFFFLGVEVSRRLWNRSAEPCVGAELVASAATVGSAVWIGSLWLLAIAGFLTAPVLLARTIVVAVIATVLWIGRRDEAASPQRTPRRILVFIPLALWIALVMMRGAVVGPLSHDALSHHLPKAIVYARAASYEPLPQLPARSRNLPVDYELLLAEATLIDGSDADTEWLSVIHYLFFIVSAAALSQRWWRGNGGVEVAVAMFTAGIPVVLLHSAAHKNDLMTAAAMTAALVFLGRFVSTDELLALILSAAAIAMAAGTKLQAAPLALAALPFVVWRLSRAPRFARRFAIVAIVSIVFVALLGGAFLLLNGLVSGGSAGASPAAAKSSPYGDWQNFYQVPYVLIAAPFTTGASSLSVPWSEQPWFWRRYEIYFSELGIPFAVCALLLPVAVFVYRRRTAEHAPERAVVSLVALLTFVLLLPIVFRPAGLYAVAAPRYVLFVAPVVFAWTLTPFLRFTASTFGRRVIAATSVLVFVLYAALAATRDAFASPEFVIEAARNGGTRRIPFDPDRAASIVDAQAPADAAVAIEASDGAWIYPLFGSDLRRPVQLLAAGVPPADLRADVEWVAIDRKFAAIWKHEAFRHLGQSSAHQRGGAVSLKEDHFFRFFAGDPKWELIHFESDAAQAVFRRRSPSALQSQR